MNSPSPLSIMASALADRVNEWVWPPLLLCSLHAFLYALAAASQLYGYMSQSLDLCTWFYGCGDLSLSSVLLPLFFSLLWFITAIALIYGRKLALLPSALLGAAIFSQEWNRLREYPDAGFDYGNFGSLTIAVALFAYIAVLVRLRKLR